MRASARLAEVQLNLYRIGRLGRFSLAAPRVGVRPPASSLNGIVSFGPGGGGRP